ncbi:MAG: stage II sporulation protein M, partial [Armatimonadota bacterium]
FLSAQFPRRVRETLPYSAAALLVCVLAGVAGFAAVMADPETASAFIPETLRRHVESRMSSGEMDGPSLPLDLSPLLSSAILFNNVRVAVLSFGLGITAGLGTVCVLIQNGLLLGALAGIAARHEASAAFWALILPHGVIEMAAIFIAAGSGLKIAHALIAPGDLTRRDALVRAAREVTPLLLGAVSMLAVAALVEGFLTPAPVPDSVKLAFGGATLCLLVAYFALAGRGRHRDGRHDPARLESGLRGKQV